MKVSDQALATLIASLEQYKAEGVIDPWLLSDGTVIEPLDVLTDLRHQRSKMARLLAAIAEHWRTEDDWCAEYKTEIAEALIVTKTQTEVPEPDPQ